MQTTQFTDIVKQILQENNLLVTQPSVYHYTNADGLKGMVENNEIWLSDRECMNDANDEKFVQEYTKKVIGNEYNWDGSRVQRELTPSEEKHQYIFSTSLDDDSIHQWSYYGNGFCIEFDREGLINLFAATKEKNDEYFYGRVLYERDGNTNEIIDTVENTCQKPILEDSDSRVFSLENLEKRRLYVRVYQYFYSMLKQHGHRCESEYRFLIQTDLSPEFRTKNGLFVPYIKTKKVTTANNCLPIKRIIISPTNSDEMVKRNLEFFLKQNGYQSVKVDFSEMKVRQA